MPDTLDRLKAALADRYAIERELGSGGMATVYLAEDLKHERKVAVKSGKLARRSDIPPVTVENTRTGFFGADELKVLLAELPETLRGLIEAAYLMGWRIPSELMPMQWRQVDLKAGIVRLEPGTTKNGNGRTFPIHALPRLAAVFERQRAYTKDVQRRTGQVVRSVFHREGRPIKNFRAAWHGACERAGLADKIPHDFRRTAVRNLERASVSRSVAMKLVGHETEDIYKRYAIVAEQDLADGVTKLIGLEETADRKGHPIAGTIGAQ